MNKPKGLSCAHLFNKVVRAVTKAWNMESFWLYPAIFDIRIAFHVEKLWGFMTCRFWRQACMLVEVRPNCWRVEGVGRWKLKNRQRKRHRSCEYKQKKKKKTQLLLSTTLTLFFVLYLPAAVHSKEACTFDMASPQPGMNCGQPNGENMQQIALKSCMKISHLPMSSHKHQNQN